LSGSVLLAALCTDYQVGSEIVPAGIRRLAVEVLLNEYS
jgi:hypothetical protein